MASLPDTLSLPTTSLVNQTQGLVGDARALADWLAVIGLRNSLTAKSYRKEVIRYHIFLETIHEKSVERDRLYLLRDATEMDVALYEAHLSGRSRSGDPVNPLVVPAHILTRHGKVTQPFLSPPTGNDTHELVPLALQMSSVNQAMSILHALYSHWLHPDPQTKMAYVGANPVRRIKRSSVRAQRQVDRSFPIEAVVAMLLAAKQQADIQPTPAKKAVLFRRRWIAALLFGLWGRRAEIARLKMSDFKQTPTNDWIARMFRKGGNTQDIPVASWVIDELMSYRRSLQLSPLPARNEELSCIQRLRGGLTNDNVDPDLIYREVCALASDAATALRDSTVLPELSEIERESLAAKLELISPHWFRHSGASIAINSGAMSLPNASKMLGHSTPAVTATMYFHPELREMQRGIETIGHQAFEDSRF